MLEFFPYFFRGAAWAKKRFYWGYIDIPWESFENVGRATLYNSVCVCVPGCRMGYTMSLARLPPKRTIADQTVSHRDMSPLRTWRWIRARSIPRRSPFSEGQIRVTALLSRWRLQGDPVHCRAFPSSCISYRMYTDGRADNQYYCSLHPSPFTQKALSDRHSFRPKISVQYTITLRATCHCQTSSDFSCFR